MQALLQPPPGAPSFRRREPSSDTSHHILSTDSRGRVELGPLTGITQVSQSTVEPCAEQVQLSCPVPALSAAGPPCELSKRCERCCAGLRYLIPGTGRHGCACYLTLLACLQVRVTIPLPPGTPATPHNIPLISGGEGGPLPLSCVTQVRNVWMERRGVKGSLPQAHTGKSL
jgi:hypothetical protein